MMQLLAVAKNTYFQAVRQPLFGIVVLLTLGCMGFAPAMSRYTLDDDDKMLRDLGLSTLLVQGLFLACFAASSVIDTEIEEKTALTVISKPISRSIFVLGKYFGVVGALGTAYYLALIALYMAMRHGTLQTAAEEFDLTVLIFGPGMMLLVLIAATLMNYVYEWRFLPTMVGWAVACLTLSTIVLFVIDRGGRFDTSVSSHDIAALPADIVEAPEGLRGIVEFKPDPGNRFIEGHSGKLARSKWKGPINDADREYLLGLSTDIQWRKDVNYLVKETRKAEGPEIFKACVLIFGAIALLASIAVAASTRMGVFATFLICFMALCAGLTADQLLKPIAEAGTTWARYTYPLVPNFQCFWMVDALSEHRNIPPSYIGHAFGYAGLYITAILFLAMSLFQTREVG